MTRRPEDQERDPALASAWAAQSRELPAPALDQSILAAAHRAVKAGPRDAAEPSALARRPQRWWMPLAAAAVIGVVAIGVVQVLPESELLTPHEKLVATPSTRSAATNAETDGRQQNASRPQPSPNPAPADRGQRNEATPNAPIDHAQRTGGSPDATPADRTQRTEGSASPSQPPALPSQPPALAARAPVTAGAPAAASAPSTALPQNDQRARADEPSARRDSDAAGAQKSKRPQEASKPSASLAAPTAPTPDRDNKVSTAPEPFPGTMPAPAASERKAEVAAAPAVPSPPPAARDAPVPQSARAPSAPTPASPRPPVASAASPVPPLASAASPVPPLPPATSPVPPAAAPAPAVAPPAPSSSAPAPGRFASPQPSPLREAATGSEAAGRTAMPMRQSAPTALAKTAGEAQAKARDPDAWLARIRKLRDEGDVPTAERELREFRHLVPDADARIPPDLRAWATTVR